MATTIKQTEAEPADYPEAPEGLSNAAAALEPAFLWQRLEHYTVHRWSPREVVWTVEGPGDWHPPLTPATIDTVEIWQSGDWQETDLPPSPLGGVILTGPGPYRITATVGADNEPPEAVTEAFRRLAEYSAQKPGKAGARHERIQAGSVTVSRQRHEAWMGRAMANSGAGDLLRPYRRP